MSTLSPRSSHARTRTMRERVATLVRRPSTRSRLVTVVSACLFDVFRPLVAVTVSPSTTSGFVLVRGRCCSGGPPLVRTTPACASPTFRNDLASFTAPVARHLSLRRTRSFATASSSDDDVVDLVASVETALVDEVLPSANDDDDDDDDDDVLFLLGVSGGCDSVALFHAMVELRSRRPSWRLRATHFDHRRRGAESDGDRLFVEDLCEQHDVPLDVFFWEDDDEDVPFSQAAARDWRRREQTRLAARHGAARTIVLTGHHADDSDETLLLRFLRGAHATNLSGLDVASSTRDGVGTVRFARPLLRVRKDAVRAWLTARGSPWREDASNRSEKYLRNRVRNELIPLMADLAGGEDALRRRLADLDEQTRALREDADERAARREEELVVDDEETSSSLFALPPGWERRSDARRPPLTPDEERALYRWSARCMTDPPHAMTQDRLRSVREQLRDHPERRAWTIELGRGHSLRRRGDVLAVVRDGETTEEKDARASDGPWRWCVATEEEDQETGTTLRVPSTVLTSSSSRSDGDDDVVVGPYFTTVGDGDGRGSWTFRPPWRTSPIKMKDFLRGRKVPLHERPNVRMLVGWTNDEDEDEDENANRRPRVLAVLTKRADDATAEWTIDGDFVVKPDDTNDMVVVRIQLKGLERS